MTLSEYCAALGLRGKPAEERDVERICCSTGEELKNALFFCIPGSKEDGHTFARQAMAAGAVAVVCQKDIGVKNQLFSDDTARDYALAAQLFYRNPAERLRLVAVTGTNGKTTVSHMLCRIAEHCGIATGVIGTLGATFRGETVPTQRTTPSAGELARILAEFSQKGAELVVLEASSHALVQRRLAGLRFAAGIFTNLSRDHLDYHRTMEDYFAAKALLCSQSDRMVINIDDSYGRRLCKRTDRPLTYSAQWTAGDLRATELSLFSGGSRFTVRGEGVAEKINLSQPGLFSVSNGLAALGGAVALGLDPHLAAEGLSSFRGVRGRAEVLSRQNDICIICDYAHSGDSLEKILRALRWGLQGRLILLFGCAGGRDRSKRLPMAEAAARFADRVILSSDNPRWEDPLEIIGEVSGYLEKLGVDFVAEPDREKAIALALAEARPGDTLLLAGKGHEDYQELAAGKIPMDERKIVSRLLAERKY